MDRLIRVLTILLVASIWPLTFGSVPARAADSYDATVDYLFHGFLLVTDVQCHAHQLASSIGRAGVSRQALNAWGTKHFNIHVETHYSGGLEYADEIYPRGGKNAITKCTVEKHAFDTHVDGRITSWSEGNAVGDVVIMTSSGATRQFTFLAGKEPTVNGHQVFCQNGPDPDVGCASLKALITFNRTKVRIFYKIIDSPDGPSDEITTIRTL